MYTKVNITYKSTSRYEAWRGKVFGPFYYINSFDALISYLEQVESKKFVSAFEHLLTSGMRDNVPLDRLDHYLDEKRTDYGQQRAIHFAGVTQRKGLLVGAVDMQQQKYLGLVKLLDKYSGILVNQNGGYQPFDEEEMEITDMDIPVTSTDNKDRIDVEVAKFLLEDNLSSASGILLLENGFEISEDFYSKVYPLFKTTQKKERVFNFKHIDKLQTKLLFNIIETRIHTIAFETQFMNAEQIKGFIGMLCNINKCITFYILSSINPQNAIEEHATGEQKELLKKHKIIHVKY